MGQITIRANEELLKKVRLQANKQGRSIASIFREALIQYLESK